MQPTPPDQWDTRQPVSHRARPAGVEQNVGHHLPEINWQTGAAWCCLQGT